MAPVKRTVGTEQYFTDAPLAQRCVALTDETLGLGGFSLVIEPSAGDGSFLRLLPAGRRLGVDVDPRADDVVRADFLTWSPSRRSGRTLVIGNPPFGQRAALAMAFLDRACSFADAVALVLPRSFNKYTFQDRVDERFHLLTSMDCEDFHDADGRPRTVKAVFQVWERREPPRTKVVRPDSHPDFTMRHCHLSRVGPERLEHLREEYEFTIPQVGSRFSPRDVASVTRGSHWFVRPLTAGVRQRFELLDLGFLENMNTAHTSLSKRDVVRAYAAVVEGTTTAV